MPECWASSISPCEGGTSREHLVSRCLFENMVTIRGLHWCKDEFKTIGIDNLVSKCLCRKHNSELSRCDEEAMRVRDAMRWMIENRFGVSSGRERTRRVNAFHFSQWMSKTACDILASSGKYIPPALVNFAFAPSDDRNIRVYLYVSLGDRLELNDDHLGIYWIHERDNPDGMLICFMFRGLPWIIGTMDIEQAQPVVNGELGFPAMEVRQFLSRPTEIRFGNLRKGKIQFRWGTRKPQ